VSVLENYHASVTFETFGANVGANLFGESQHIVRPHARNTNLLINLKPDQIQAIRKNIINSILMTDMTKHFELQSKLESQANSGGFTTTNVDHRLLISAALLHAADISNQAKPIPISQAWSDRVFQEFLAQGDLEKHMGLPISPFCDRETANQAKLCSNFIDFICAPFYKVLAGIAPEFDVSLSLLRKSREFWNSQLPDSTAVSQVKAKVAAKAKRAEKGKLGMGTRSKSDTDLNHQDKVLLQGSVFQVDIPRAKNVRGSARTRPMAKRTTALRASGGPRDLGMILSASSPSLQQHLPSIRTE
jgi:3'5'-cyclic nucleotide phosphodiesterase